MLTRASAGRDTVRLIGPFVAVVAVAIASVALGPHHTSSIVVPGVMSFVLGACAVLVPWRRLPAGCRSLPAFGFFAVIVVLRGDAHGGDSSFNALTMLPLLWIALYASRRELWIAIGIVFLSFVVPLLVEVNGAFVAADWRRGLLWVLVCAVIGSEIQGLVRRADARGRDAAHERTQLQGVLAAATSYSIIGTDRAGMITVFNVGAERMLGYDAVDVIGRLSASVMHVADELREHAEELGIEPGLEALTHAADHSVVERRQWTYVRRDGSHVPVALTVSTVCDHRGVVQGYIGIAEDISERLAARRDLLASEENLRTVAQVTRGLSNGANARQEICAAAKSIAHADIVQLWEPEHGTHLYVTACDGDATPDLRVPFVGEPSGVVGAYESGKRRLILDVSSSSAGVSTRIRDLLGVSSVLYEPVPGRDGALGVLVVLWKEPITEAHDHDVAAVGLLAAEAAVAIQRADMTAQLEDQARTDALTGLANRRSWDEELPRALRRAERFDHPVCVAVIDLDHFKDFNDAHGHPAGDRLLRAAAASWHTCLRSTDLLARYGGEEFAVVLPDTDIATATLTLDRLRTATPGSQTCSVGIAMWDRSESADAVLARADALVYEAKRGGRNRVAAAAR